MSCACGHVIVSHACPNVTIVGTTEPVSILPIAEPNLKIVGTVESVPIFPISEIYSP